MPIDILDADGSSLLLHLSTDAWTMLTELLGQLGADVTYLTDEDADDIPADICARYADVLIAAWDRITVTGALDDRYANGERKALVLDTGDPLAAHPDTRDWLRQFTELCRTKDGLTVI